LEIVEVIRGFERVDRLVIQLDFVAIGYLENELRLEGPLDVEVKFRLWENVLICHHLPPSSKWVPSN